MSWGNLALLARGAVTTLQICAVGIILGCGLGFGIAFLRISKNKGLNLLSVVYIEIFRGSPLLIQLFLFYYGLPILLNIQVSASVTATVTITLNSAAYIAEIFKSAMGGVEKGQWEASSSLGLSYLQGLRYVVLPRAFRIAIPPLVSEFVAKIKGSSLASIIGFVELTRLATVIRNQTFTTFDVLGAAAMFYFVMCYSLSRFGGYMEKRLEVKA